MQGSEAGGWLRFCVLFACCRQKALPAVRVSLSTSSNQGNLDVDPTPQQLAFWLILDPVKLTARGSAVGMGQCSEDQGQAQTHRCLAEKHNEEG